MYYENGSFKLYYEKYGNEKETILILPGWGDTRPTFDYLVNNLKRDYSVYIIDNPPFGKSEVLQEEKRLDETIKLIREKISELGQELYDRNDKVLEFKKFMWDNRASMDGAELRTMMSDNDLEISMMMKNKE